jgi:hypothetical protein
MLDNASSLRDDLGQRGHQERRARANANGEELERYQSLDWRAQGWTMNDDLRKNGENMAQPTSLYVNSSPPAKRPSRGPWHVRQSASRLQQMLQKLQIATLPHSMCEGLQRWEGWDAARGDAGPSVGGSSVVPGFFQGLQRARRAPPGLSLRR